MFNKLAEGHKGFWVLLGLTRTIETFRPRPPSQPQSASAVGCPTAVAAWDAACPFSFSKSLGPKDSTK